MIFDRSGVRAEWSHIWVGPRKVWQVRRWFVLKRSNKELPKKVAVLARLPDCMYIWVSVKELNVSYYTQESLLVSKYPF